MKSFHIASELRSSRGKNASRRLRSLGKIPAILYGQKEESLSLSLDPRNLQAILHSASGHNTIFSLEVKDRGTTSVMMKDWQFDPIKETLLHADLLRIAMDKVLQIDVPIVAVGLARGVKDQGGILELVLRQLEIQCLPTEIPDHISVDVSDLEIGSNVRVSDLLVDSKLKVLSDSDLVVAHVIAPKEEQEEEVGLVEGTQEKSAEPEVIKKGKGELEEGAGATPTEEEKGN